MAVRELEPRKVRVHNELQPEVKEWLEAERVGKKTVVIVGFAPTSRSIAPYDNEDPDIEIWGVNEAYRHNFMVNSEGEFVADRWFQIHKPWSYRREYNRNHPNHWLWLQNKTGPCRECQGKGEVGPEDSREPCEDCGGTGKYVPRERPLDLPIYMQDVDPDVPGSEKFPLQEIIDEFLPGLTHGKKTIEYFTSSFAYMCALAMWLNKDDLENLRIEVYGFEMSTETEYHYQKGSTEFWIGLAKGKGVDIFLPEGCQLLHGAKYGFEVTQMINRQELEFRKRQLQEAEQQKVASLNQVSGRRNEIERELGRLQKDIQNIAEKLEKKDSDRLAGKLEAKQEQMQERMQERAELVTKEVNALSEANAVVGALQEISGLIQYIDHQYTFDEEAEMPMRVPEPAIRPMEAKSG